jgi:general secretion pathway protein B
MSIILDALRKSESERLREAETHRSELPRARGRTRMPWWVWAVALLLLANIAVLLWLVLRPAPATTDSFTSRAAGREVRDLERLAAAGTETTGSAAAAGARRTTPDIPPAQFPVRNAEPAAAPTLAPTDAIRAAAMPTLAQRAAEAVAAEGPGRIAGNNGGNGLRGEAPSNLPTTLPEGVPALDVSLHYYDSASSRSFISINGHTARDGTVLPEGPQVERVTEEGAILNYRGQRFLLPRN